MKPTTLAVPAVVSSLLVVLAACGNNTDKTASGDTTTPSAVGAGTSSSTNMDTGSTFTSDNPGSSSTSTGMDMSGDHSPIPPNTQVMTPSQEFTYAKKGVFLIYGRKPEGTITGTGFVHDIGGQFGITNAHVISGVSALRAVFYDGTTLPLHVMGQDPCADVALVHWGGPTPKGVIRLPIGDPTALHATDFVMSVGYPESVAASLTHQHAVPGIGIVQNASIRAHIGDDLPNFDRLIEHTAQVNPGSSGGPLLDNKGNVVGITFLGARGPEPTSTTTEYAIPIDTAHQLVDDKFVHEQSQNYTGLTLIPRSIEPLQVFLPANQVASAQVGAVMDAYLHKNHIGGMIVTAIQADSPLSGKIFPGDLITALGSANQVPMNNMNDLCTTVESILPGTPTQVEGTTVVPTSAFPKPWTVTFKFPGTH
jgi:S1-C subfamily serine protease